MKITSIYKGFLILSLLISASCVDNEPKIEDIPNDKVAFMYSVKGDYPIDYYVGSLIQFENTSSEQGAVTWNFGDGSPEVNEPNPIHKYTVPGTYEVTLSLDGVGHRKQSIMISDITPIIKTNISTPICLAMESNITFDVELPNPENLQETYEWVFPEGTTDAEGNLLPGSSDINPGTLRFSNVGSQGVVLKTKLAGRSLPQVRIDVQVGYSQPSKTLYYAVKGGNLAAYKLIKNKPSGMNVSPFNLGVKSGQHPFNIFFNDTAVYILDAGKQFTYINDVDKTLGDGKISVISKDGSTVETILDNIGGYAFDDPYFGYLDVSSKTLHFTDRNTGISQVTLDKRNEKLNRTAYPFWVENARLGYYGNGIVYGAGNAGITKDGDTWWWNKSFLSMGIFRFKNSDIKPGTVGSGTEPAPASGIALPNIAAKATLVDSKNKMVYVTVPSSDAIAGFYAIPMSDLPKVISESTLKPYCVKLLPPDGEGATEMVHISQLVLDPEDGSVYFAYRAPAKNQTLNTGIKRYNPTTKLIESVVDGVEAYGITINNEETQLF